MLVTDTARDGVHITLRRRKRCARLEPRDDAEVVRTALVFAHIFSGERCGLPEADVPVRELKPGRHDSDYHIRFSIERDCSPDDVRVRGKAAPPQAVTY